MSRLKISRSYLTRIIREELKTVLDEDGILSDANYYHKADGTWGSKTTGNVKSLSRAAAKRLGVQSKHVGKSIVANDPDKTRVKYHMSDCGRTDVESGRDREIKYNCRSYPEKYKNEVMLDEDEVIEDGQEEQQRAYMKGSVDLAVKDALRKNKKAQPCDLNAILAALDSFSKAEKGKYQNGGKG